MCGQVYYEEYCIYVLAGRLTFARPCEGGPQELIAYEFVLISLAMSRMSGPSILDRFRHGVNLNNRKIRPL